MQNKWAVVGALVVGFVLARNRELGPTLSLVVHNIVAPGTPSVPCGLVPENACLPEDLVREGLGRYCTHNGIVTFCTPYRADVVPSRRQCLRPEPPQAGAAPMLTGERVAAQIAYSAALRAYERDVARGLCQP